MYGGDRYARWCNGNTGEYQETENLFQILDGMFESFPGHMKNREEYTKIHLELYGYKDPFFDINDGSLRSELVKLHILAKTVGLDLTEHLKADIVTMAKTMQNFIFSKWQ